ncbi:hypothetical protein FHS61_001037 [Altererythrobacter atlanticus]|uniref:Uncharacterized protein n=1 Tax=Croceibacterium atlanticum TaxID=1267766 RepID=A0A0F7KVR4_9SPHN|nr:hypothetical protein [Croceibacterium atlanticum]AKH43261.1 hypothetical protein WYH_02229 [Croceibacterium atlanticum]MBB5732033.1 hypothetical protein [Croceibacterium atlanticum]
MNALSPSFRAGKSADRPDPAPDVIGMKWAALAEAANIVADLAGIETEIPLQEMQDMAALNRRAEGWRRQRAERCIADLTAAMEPGITALLAIQQKGNDPRPAANALWREFSVARETLLSLLPPNRRQRPR